MRKFIKVVCLLLSVIGLTSCIKAKSDNYANLPLLHFYTFGSQQQDIGIINEEMSKITAEKIGARVEMHIISSNSYMGRIRELMKDKEACDVMFVGYNNPYTKMVQNGYLYPLSGMMDKETPLLRKTVSGYLFEAVKYDGEIYAVPNEQIEVTQYAVLVKKDLADEYDFDAHPVANYEDMDEFFEWVKRTHPQIYPTASPKIAFEYELENELVCANFFEGLVGILKEDGSVKVVHESETNGYKRMAELCREWYQKGYIRKDIDSVTDYTYYLQDGSYASVVDLYKPGIEWDYEEKYGYSVVPVLKSKPYMGNANLLTTMLGVGAYSEHPELSLKLIELLNTNEELYNLACFGVEGMHYDKCKDGKISLRKESGYRMLTSWAFGNQFNAYIQSGQESDIWARTKQLNDEAQKSPFIGFFCEDIANDHCDKIAQIENITTKWYSYAKKGTQDMDNWYPEYMEQLKLAGVEELKAVIQKKVDEHLKTKKD